MASGPRYKLPFRRRRENRTDYRSRKALLKSGLPRAVVRRSNRHVRIQVAYYSPKGDEIAVSAYSGELAVKDGVGNFDNIPGAYLTGFLAGKRCLKAGIEQAVLDIGRHQPARGSVVFAAMKGMLDAGISISHDDSILPSDDRISGKHLSEDFQVKFNEIKERIQKGEEEVSGSG